MGTARGVAAAAIFLAHAPAFAAEVQVEGFYQMRGRLYDTLSLDRDIAASEGLSWYVQHRLWLRPKLLVSDRVALMVDVRALDRVYWGDQPVFDPIRVLDAPPDIESLSDDLQPPGFDADDTRRRLDVQLWRAWGEVRTNFGTFKFGRQPLHWGLGLWQNDGLASNTDHGDSADRISYEHKIQDIWFRVAADVNAEGLVNEADDTTSFNVAAAYRTERAEGGIQYQFRRRSGANRFDVHTVDGAFDLAFGPIGVAGEVVGQFGGGDLSDGVTGVKLASVGAVVDLGVKLEKIRAGVEAGLASGDGNPDDAKLSTFTFDRDYNVGFLMFEQPMPVLQAPAEANTSDGRSREVTLTGDAVSNAMYLKPRFAYRLVPGLWAEASLLAARTMKVPETVKTAGRRSYGFEIDAGVRYTGLEHLEVGATFGAFIPGTFYRNFQDDTYQGFRAPVFGGQLLTRIRF